MRKATAGADVTCSRASASEFAGAFLVLIALKPKRIAVVQYSAEPRAESLRTSLAAEFESTCLPHVAGDLLARTSSFGQSACVATVAGALASSYATCGCAKEAE